LNKTAVAMLFGLAQAARKSWRRPDGQPAAKSPPEYKIHDGIEVVNSQIQAAAARPLPRLTTALPAPMSQVPREWLLP